MWYILPTPPYLKNGRELGSAKNQRYALRKKGEGLAYLSFQADGMNLRQNYIEIMGAVRDQLARGISAISLMGIEDVPKLQSSATLFESLGREARDQEVQALCSSVLVLLNAGQLTGDMEPTQRPSLHHQGTPSSNQHAQRLTQVSRSGEAAQSHLSPRSGIIGSIGRGLPSAACRGSQSCMGVGRGNIGASCRGGYLDYSASDGVQDEVTPPPQIVSGRSPGVESSEAVRRRGRSKPAASQQMRKAGSPRRGTKR